MTGPVEAALVDGIREKGCIHLALIDPEKFSNNLPQIVTDLEDHGTSAIMIGGSTLKSSTLLDRTVRTIRDSCSLPTILFPNGPVGISRFAHAIFFMYLEAGSGAEHMVDPRMVSKVSERINVPLIVGGGIRTPSQAERLAKAGASAIVTGTVIEQEGPGRVKQILAALKRA